ncbi:N-acetylmuramoyl-L-alanine amidase [Brevibacterium permense]|uniref:peptidoglycan recognition protein family protein n=1 Tax=Brevibacterium permense TaxID=234834 RepID=UPI0021CFEFCE|nr:N-acetylmuramoyl-L-alanine amidase [Brevibacterium permense]MCU4295808.1 N-acetylmuramoyl-L-alanine amidase [Brevibacterium permense]
MPNYTVEKRPTRNTSTRAHYGHGKKPDGLTIHHWGSDGQKHDNVVSWLTGVTGNKGSSAHEVISAGRVTVLAPPEVATWHAGSTAGNGATMGLECRPEMTDADWDTLVERCADLEEELGSLKYWKHSDWKNTACPGRYRDRIGELVDDVNAEHKRRKNGEGKREPVPADPPKEKPSKGDVPGPGHDFPLGPGMYFGPANWGDNSVSGKYGRSFHGRPDYWWLKEFARQLARRGWNIGKGKTWLNTYGNDGHYGDEYAALIRKFQEVQGLAADGLIGKDTWNEAFKEPVT